MNVVLENIIIEIQNYYTRVCTDLRNSLVKHEFSRKCIRNKLPIVINKPPLIILNKTITHSMLWPVSLYTLKKYVLVNILPYVVLITVLFVTCLTMIVVIIIIFLILLFHNFLVLARSHVTKRSNLPLIQYQNRPFVTTGAEFNSLLHSVVRSQRAVSAYFI